MLEIKQKVYIRLGEKETKALMRKKIILVHNSLFREYKTSNTWPEQRSSQPRILL